MAITTNGAAGVSADAVATLTNKTLISPTITDATFSGQQTGLEIAFAQSIVFEGTTANNFETTLSAGEPTADRVLTLPDSTGTLATMTDVQAGPNGGVTETGTQTLTNKTLTSPVLGGTTTTASGNLVVGPAAYILEVRGGASTEGMIQLNCAVNSHGQKIRSQTHAEAASNTLLLPGGTTIGNADAVLVSNTGTQTLTNKTLTSAILTGTLTANGSVGTAGQVLTSTGSGVEYTTASAGTTANDQAFAFAVQVFS